jgi:hypothetical protein
MARVLSIHRPCGAGRLRRSVDSFFQRSASDELSVGDRVLFSVTTVVPKGATVVRAPDPANAFGALVVKEWNSKKHELSRKPTVLSSIMS